MKHKGFTLVKLIVVVGVVFFLIAVIFVAINPQRCLAESRNAQRWQETNATLNAVLKYQADNDGSHLASVAALTADTNYIIGTAATGCDTGCTQAGTTDSACADFSGLVDEYIESVPIDPDTSTWDVAKTGYYLTKTTSGRITIGVCVPDAEGGSTPSITATR